LAYCIDYRCGVLEKPDPEEEGEDDLDEVDEAEQENVPSVSGDTKGNQSWGIVSLEGLKEQSTRRRN